MSAIDCKLDLSRKSDPKGDRIVVTIDGKFLPYYDGSLQQQLSWTMLDQTETKQIVICL